VTGGWRKLHNEELHNLYSSPNIIRMIKLLSFDVYSMGKALAREPSDHIKEVS
jgi:hypothetical protein